MATHVLPPPTRQEGLAARLVDRTVPRHRIAQRTAVTALLSAYDSLCTWAWVTMGVGTEANPAVDRVMVAFGPTNGLLLRTVYAVAIIGILGWLTANRPNRTMRGMLAATLLAMVGISIWHTGFGVLYTLISLGAI